jgi:hypothetical protein
MTTVVITHAVGDMDTWLKGGEERKALFSKYCSSHRIFTQEGTNRVSIVCDNVDLAKMQAAMNSPEIAKGKTAHTVIDPLEVYIEVAGGK